MQYEIKFLWALALTIVVEGVVIVGALRFSPLQPKRKISWQRCVVAGIVPSFSTLPYLWFVLPFFLKTYFLRTLSGEIGIIIIEALVLRYLTNIKWRRVTLLSFIANGASIIAGLIVF